MLFVGGCADNEKVATDGRVTSAGEPAPPNFAQNVAAATPMRGTVTFELEFIIGDEPFSMSTGEVDLAAGTGRSTDVLQTGSGSATVEVTLADGEMTERDLDSGRTRPVDGGSVPELLKVPAVGGADDADNLSDAIAMLLEAFSFSERLDDGEATPGSTIYDGSQLGGEDALEVWVDEDGRLTRFVYKTESADGVEATEILDLEYALAETNSP